MVEKTKKPLLVVNYPAPISQNHIDNLKSRIQGELPNYDVLVVDSGASVSVFPASFADVA